MYHRDKVSYRPLPLPDDVTLADDAALDAAGPRGADPYP